MTSPFPPRYRTKNWPSGNQALKPRGSLKIWFKPNMARGPPPTGKRGRQPRYTEAALRACLTVKVLLACPST
ncbi:transposase, partial [Burkholderia sp. SIMBA_052]